MLPHVLEQDGDGWGNNMVNDEQMSSELESFCAPKKGYSSQGTVVSGWKQIYICLYTISH